MPAISLTAYRHSLDRLAEQMRIESDEAKRGKLLRHFLELCLDSRRLSAEDELKSRGIHFKKSNEV